MTVAVLTGASRGLGLALARALDQRGWQLVLDARDADRLEAATAGLSGGPHHVLAGDVTSTRHRAELVTAAADLGGADLLVNNASTLGASPLPRLSELDEGTFERVLRTNLVAPVALVRDLLPQLRERRGLVLNLSSDAAVEAYEGWGGYGSSKAALDHASAVLAAEEPLLRVHAVDPGDLRTDLHQAAFPGEDISDRPLPGTVVPALLRLIEDAGSRGSGVRHRAADLLPQVSA